MKQASINPIVGHDDCVKALFLLDVRPEIVPDNMARADFHCPALIFLNI